MESAVLKISIYFFVYVEISNLKDAVYSSALDCIPTLCVQHIKNTLKVIQELRILLLTAKTCMKSRNFMPVVKKVAKMAIELALTADYQENVRDFGIRDLNVNFFQLLESKLGFNYM